MALNRVNTQELRGTANEVEQLTAQYTQQVQSLYQSGSELDQMWDGDANTKFNARLQQDQTYFQTLSATIAKYIQALRDDADAYDRAEEANVNTIANNTVRKTR